MGGVEALDHVHIFLHWSRAIILLLLGWMGSGGFNVVLENCHSSTLIAFSINVYIYESREL